MKTYTLELPDAFAERLERYLTEHPDKTAADVFQEAATAQLLHPEPTPMDWDAFMALAGIVAEGEPSTSERPEDEVIATDSRDA